MFTAKKTSQALLRNCSVDVANGRLTQLAFSNRVSWNPDTIFFKELRIIGSFAQIHCFGRSVRYLDSGKLKLKGIITDVYRLSEFQDALDKIQSRKWSVFFLFAR